MIVRKDLRKPALTIGKQTLLFSDLGVLIDEQKRNIVSAQNSSHKEFQAFIVTIDHTAEKIAQALALFELGLPVVFFSPDLTEAERQTRYDLLGSYWIEEQTGQWTSFSTKATELHKDCALLLFTSGSTGVPKGVQLSYQNIEANTAAVIKSLGFHETTKQYLFLPMSYSFGFLGQLLPALRCEAETILIPQFSMVRDFFAANNSAGMWSGVPSHWEALCRLADNFPAAAQQLTKIVSAGSSFSLDLKNRLREKFPNAIIYNNYGLTEGSPRVLSLSSEEPHFFEECVGRPVGDWQARLGHGDELEVKGSQVMLGYLSDSEGTRQKVSEDGWLKTGDAAIIDPQTKIIKILGRTDEVFNVAGERTSSQEIESALVRTMLVSEAAVVGVADPIYGRKVIAFLKLKDSATSKGQILSSLKQNIVTTKFPREFYLVESLPRRENGKLDRPRLLELINTSKKLV